MAITNTRKKLVSLRPADTNEAQLYVVPAGSEIDAVLRVCNQDTSSRTCRVAHCDAAHGDNAAEGKDWLVYDWIIPVNETRELSIHAYATEPIRIKASTANVLSFHLSGNLKVTT
jgi:hypothetical protein